MTDWGARAREDMIDKVSANTMKIVPEIQVVRVSTVVACRPPRRPSVIAEPPPTAARPPPFPDCRRITTVMKMPSNTRAASSIPYIFPVFLRSVALNVDVPIRSVNGTFQPAARTIEAKDSASRLAPPTSTPSTSLAANNS